MGSCHLYLHAVYICRIPELLFQPSMVGIEQAGIAEIIDFVLNKYASEEQDKLVQVKNSWCF